MLYEIDGVKLINCTPHEIRFQNNAGEVITVEKSGYTLPATPEEYNANYLMHGRFPNVQLVKTKFITSRQGISEIEEIWDKYGSGVLIVGSIISAQAYNGIVVSLVSVPGLERSTPQNKLYLANKFVIF